MGRKKGKQCGSFGCKKLNAEYHHKLYVDNASEADQYRNPISKHILGIGLGYRSATTYNDRVGQWDRNGRSCHGDKWSSVFAHRHPEVSSSVATRSSASTRDFQNSARGLAHLRHLLEERHSEDRFHDRQLRLALQRSRIREAHFSSTGRTRENAIAEEILFDQSQSKTVRNEPGWLLSHSFETSGDAKRSPDLIHNHSLSDNQHQIFVFGSSTEPKTHDSTKDSIPSLQLLAAQVLGPLLPVYVASCGHEFVGECLKSASPDILGILSVSLAKSSSPWCHGLKDKIMYATTDGTVKALAYSGVATGLVLKGAPLMMPRYYKINEKETKDDNDETRCLSDQGLLALCPRLLPRATETGDVPDLETAITDIEENCDWETLDVDLDFTARMVGCFHLTRLELVDVPLQCSPNTQGGITLGALRTVLKSCPGITHLALTGSFYNWADLGSNVLPHGPFAARNASEDVSFLLSGTTSTFSSAQTWNGSPPGQLGHYNQEHSGDQACDIKGLHQLLPELEVLDVSNCSWITPTLIFRFLFQCRDEMTKVHGASTSENISDNDEWGKKYAVPNTCNVGQISEISGIGSQHLPSISLRLLCVMGCNFSLEDSHMIEEWVNHSLSGNFSLLTGLS